MSTNNMKIIINPPTHMTHTNILNTVVTIPAKQEPFKIFKYTANSMNDCESANEIDTTAGGMSDSQRFNVQCHQCQFWCWPFIFVYDVTSCPFRCCYHLKQKHCS